MSKDFESIYQGQTLEDLLREYSEGNLGNKSIQPNWMESDKTKPAFIQNKTHYCFVDRVVTENGQFDATDYVYHGEGGLFKIPVGTSDLKVNTSGPPITVSRPGDTTIIVSGDQGTYLTTFPLYLVSNIKRLSEEFIPETIARKTDIALSDWNEQSESAPSYIKNRPFGIIGFQNPVKTLSISESTIGTNLFEVYTDVCFQIGLNVYNTLHELGKEIILSVYGGPSVTGTVVKEGEQYFVRHVSGTTLISDVTYCNRVDINTIPEAYIPENIVREEELTPRNVGVEDTATEEVDDTIPLATTDYVNKAIASAITLTINADY